MNKVEENVKNLVEDIIVGTALKLVQVEYVREGREWFLRVYLSKPGGIEIEDCVLVSRQLSKKLDESDLIKTQYYLEVSSPGTDETNGDAGGKIE
ncbi:MAG: hypothetical protein MJ041_05215 [Acidaminococcaceae bacterium]|nr:hypothetical protein [Acidaminococcaceae bacterium]